MMTVLGISYVIVRLAWLEYDYAEYYSRVIVVFQDSLDSVSHPKQELQVDVTGKMFNNRIVYNSRRLFMCALNIT